MMEQLAAAAAKSLFGRITKNGYQSQLNRSKGSQSRIACLNCGILN